MSLDRRIAALEQRRGSGFVVPARDAAPEALTFLQAWYLLLMDPDMPDDRAERLRNFDYLVMDLADTRAFGGFVDALPSEIAIPMLDELEAALAPLAGNAK